MFFSLINHNGLVCCITCSYNALQFTDTLHWTFPLYIRYLLVDYISYLCCVCNVTTDIFQATMLDDRGKYSYAYMCIQWMWWCLAELHHNTSQNFNTRNLKRSPQGSTKKRFQRWSFHQFSDSLECMFFVWSCYDTTCRSFDSGICGTFVPHQEKSTYQISMPMFAIVLQIAEVVSEVFRVVTLGCFQEIRLMNSYHPWGCGIHTVNMKLIIQRIPSGEKAKCIMRLRLCFDCSGSNVFVFEQYLIWFWAGCVYIYIH